MAWIPSYTSLKSHPKTKRAARMAGINRAQLIGHLHMLWWWALEYAPDGNLSGLSYDEIEEEADWDGEPGQLINAFIDCGRNGNAGFLIKNDGGLFINDWEEYGGRYLKKKEQGRKRIKKHREKAKASVTDTITATVTEPEHNADVTRYVTQPKREQNASRIEENRKEKKEHATGEKITEFVTYPPPPAQPSEIPLIQLYMDASGETGRKSERWRAWFDDITGRYSRDDCIWAFEKLREEIVAGRLNGSSKWERVIYYLENIGKLKDSPAEKYKVPDLSNLNWAQARL